MKRCTKCLYPETTMPYITFDENGVCGGCLVAEEKKNIDWSGREDLLKDLVAPYIKDTGYDCIIPISGGKDSHYQVYYVTQVLKMRPLLVTFNHLDNSNVGLRNLENIIYKFGVDHVRFTPNPETVKKCCRHAIKKMADPFWHEHAGIYTYPVRVAVERNIPLIIWGEYGFLDLVGMFSHNDFIEMSKKTRAEHGMRGYEPEDFVKDNEEGLTLRDIDFTIYPTDKEIERVGVKGIYLGNYINWNPMEQTKKMILEYGFETSYLPETFNRFENVECYYNGAVHDHLRYLKYGYSRVVDHTSQLIRLGVLTREEGYELTKKWEFIAPKEMRKRYLEFLSWIDLSAEEIGICIKKYIHKDTDFSITEEPINMDVFNSAYKKVNTLFNIFKSGNAKKIFHCGREI